MYVVFIIITSGRTTWTVAWVYPKFLPLSAETLSSIHCNYVEVMKCETWTGAAPRPHPRRRGHCGQYRDCVPEGSSYSWWRPDLLRARGRTCPFLFLAQQQNTKDITRDGNGLFALSPIPVGPKIATNRLALILPTWSNRTFFYFLFRWWWYWW